MKWKAIGYPMQEMPPGVAPIDFELEPIERATNVIKMAQAGVIGEPGQDPDSSAEIQQLYFDSVSRAVDPSARSTATGRSRSSGGSATPPPWHLVVANGSTRAEPERRPTPTSPSRRAGGTSSRSARARWRRRWRSCSDGSSSGAVRATCSRSRKLFG